MIDQSRSSDEELAHAWIKRFSKNRTRVLSADSVDRQMQDDHRIEVETYPAFKELEKLVRDDPVRSWAIILCILKLAQQDQEALDNLAAGPLETLLVLHGPNVIERIEKDARSNPRLKALLLGVWGNAVNAAVWDRLQALLGDSSNRKGS
jgi:hypothetical protein